MAAAIVNFLDYKDIIIGLDEDLLKMGESTQHDFFHCSCFFKHKNSEVITWVWENGGSSLERCKIFKRGLVI